MATKFLTNENEETSLSQRIKALTRSSTNLDFLVGYFFFSGFCEICDDIKEKPLRILIGMDAQVDLNNCIVEYSTILKNDESPNLAVRDKYFATIKNSINNVELFDNKKFEKSFKIFLTKLLNNTLEVKKTKDPNHAKMYLFFIPPTENMPIDNSKIIIGSSNFSLEGFKARNEVNVYLQDKNDYDEGKRIFESLWEESIPLVTKENKNLFIEKVLNNTWLNANPTPYLMYIKVLSEYLKVSNDEIKTPEQLTQGRENQFFDVNYQIDAIKEGIAKVKKHSGCIIADVVGLGKSIIASAIAANLNKRVVIITPPHLKKQWEDYAADFGLIGCKIYSLGKLEEAAFENKTKDLVIIVDEAHRFRNENSEAYGYLHQLCIGNQVILLSATPFNNKPEDIFSLIKLFQIPAHSTIQTVNNLAAQMANLIINYKDLKKAYSKEELSANELDNESNKLANKVREILDPVIIRRTRIDLEETERYKKDLSNQNIDFSVVRPPVSQTYNLGKLSTLYIDTLTKLTGDESRKIPGFIGARYKPLTYLKRDPKESNKISPKLIEKYKIYFDNIENFNPGQKNMADFMKQLLVRRFESSKISFIKTLSNILESMKIMESNFSIKHKIPMSSKRTTEDDIDDLQSTTEDDIDSLFIESDELLKCQKENNKNEGLWFIDAKDLTDDFYHDLTTDIALIESFIRTWKDTNQDPKLDTIIKKIQQSLKEEPNRKIIIFSEFSDTANYLFDEMKHRNLRVLLYTSKIANKQNRNEIYYNFDAGCKKELEKNDYDILIATDAISEGFSLHRAGTIYNYDIPYNPTRVIQRVGRINRINKKMFDELYIYNFFPTATGEKISHTQEISTFKMKLFQSILGSDTKILTKDEEIDGYFSNKFEEEEKASNTKSWNVDFINELDNIKNNEPEIYNKAIALPYRCRIARKIENKEKGVLLFSKKGDAYRFSFANKDKEETAMMPAQESLKLFKTSKDETAFQVSENFYNLYNKAKKISGLVEYTPKITGNLKIINDNISKLVLMYKDEVNYLKDLKKAMIIDCIPDYYIKKLAKLKINDNDIITKMKSLVSEKYLLNILNKDNMISSEQETILLSEEFL